MDVIGVFSVLRPASIVKITKTDTDIDCVCPLILNVNVHDIRIVIVGKQGVISWVIRGDHAGSAEVIRSTGTVKYFHLIV